MWKKGHGHFHDGPAPESFDPSALARRFAAECGAVPQRISTSVLRTIREFSRIDMPRRSRRLRYRREGWQEN